MNEIASREFIDNLVSLLKAYGPAAVNDDVKNKILELIQTWAAGAEGRMNLIYISETYKTLGREGFNFPPKVDVASSMFDSTAPPEWADSDVCMRCRTAFSFTNRKHHCRNCGNVFDAACSSKQIPLPHLGILQPVRVDDGCFAKITEKSSKPGGISLSAQASKPSRTLYQGSMQPRDARVDDSFDADLKKALEMSLEDSRSAGGSGYTPQPPPIQTKPARANGATKIVKDDDEDDELKAAIAASLADMEDQKTKHAATLRNRSSSNERAPVAPVRRTDHELTPVEAENINLFSTLVDRLQHQPPGMILREPQIQELYDSIGSLRPKLARTYGETMSKYDTLVDLHNKLSTVVRYYDRMLEERLNSSFHHTPYSYNSYSSAPPPRTSSMYPNIAPSPAPTGQYAAGGPESYYTNGSAGSDPYARPQSMYGQPPQAQYQHSAPYPVRQDSTSSSTTNRAPSVKYGQNPVEYAPQTQAGQYPGPGAPPSQYAQPPQQSGPPSSDPATAYYRGQTDQYEAPPQQPQHTGPYPQVQQQHQYGQQAPQQEQPPQQHYNSAPPGQPPQQQYPGQTPSSQQYQAPPSSNAFPSAPTHQPQPRQEPAQPVVEEALIEL
jgi:growth factor-regulated tyrosine kinase substrate